MAHVQQVDQAAGPVIRHHIRAQVVLHGFILRQHMERSSGNLTRLTQLAQDEDQNPQADKNRLT